MLSQVLRMIRFGGPSAWAAVCVGMLALVLGLIGFGMAASRKGGYRLGIATLVLACLAASLGPIGVAMEHRATDAAVGDPNTSLLQTTLEKIRVEGYREAQDIAKIAWMASVLPLTFGIVVTVLSARRKEGEPFPRSRWLVAGLCAAAGVATSLGSRAASRGALPGRDLPEWDPGWGLLEAKERSATDMGRACGELEELLKNEYWDPVDRNEFPRVFDPDPRAIVPDFDAFATACARRRTDVEQMLKSPLVVDRTLMEAIQNAVRAREGEEGLLYLQRLDERTSPRLRLAGPISVSGPMTPALVRYVVHHRDMFDWCYANATRLDGRVTVEFVVGTDGNVVSSDVVESTLSEPAVPSCLAKQFTSISFPSPEFGTVTVRYPFVAINGMAPP